MIPFGFGSPKRQLRVMQVVLSLEPGGTERLVVDIANRLVAAGIWTNICCLDGTGSLERALDARVTVHSLARTPRFDLRVAFRLSRLARRLGANVLHCHQYTPFVYGCAARLASPSVGMVFTEHGRLVGASPSRKRRRVNRFLTRVGGLQFAVSNELRGFMLDEGFSARRLQVLHNGIATGAPLEPALRARARETLGLGMDDFVVGTTARFDPVKDLPTLVRAAAQANRSLAGLRLVMIGDGPCRTEIEMTARSVGLDRMVLTGYRDDVRSLLPALDVYVNCSSSEGVSVAILEAMDAALAVVATAVGGTPEIIRDGLDGWLIPPASPTALAEAIIELREQTDTRRKLGIAAHSRVQEAFSATQMLQGYLDAYGHAVSP